MWMWMENNPVCLADREQGKVKQRLNPGHGNFWFGNEKN